MAPSLTLNRVCERGQGGVKGLHHSVIPLDEFNKLVYPGSAILVVIALE